MSLLMSVFRPFLPFLPLSCLFSFPFDFYFFLLSFFLSCFLLRRHFLGHRFLLFSSYKMPVIAGKQTESMSAGPHCVAPWMTAGRERMSYSRRHVHEGRGRRTSERQRGQRLSTRQVHLREHVQAHLCARTCKHKRGAFELRLIATR